MKPCKVPRIAARSVDSRLVIGVKPCARCGTEYEVRATNGDRATYCSDCSREYKRNYKKNGRARDRCVQCDVVLEAGRSKYCSKYCNQRANGIHKPCSDCGAERERGSQSPRCEPCRAQYKRDWNRRKNTKRRKIKTGSYTLAEIAARDGYRCHLCGRKVNMDLSGRHKRGPTIDHLIPVSADGKDEPANVALAHFVCNVKRQNVGPAQLLLIG